MRCLLSTVNGATPKRKEGPGEGSKMAEELQYWADAATKNCVWCFQEKQKSYGSDGCTCGAAEESEFVESKEDKCTCAVEHWDTSAVFLTMEEAMRHGEARPYAWGKFNEGWRIWGVPCHGIMVKLLGQHNKEFKDKVEYITER